MDSERQRLVLAHALRESFWLYFLWGFGARQYCLANPQDNWVWPPLHRTLCEWLHFHITDWESKRNRGLRIPKRLLVQIFRGGGKSTVGSALDTWLQVRDPNLAEMISSYDEDKAKEFLAVDKAVFEGTNPYGLFKDVFGVWSPASDERVWQASSITHMMRENPALRDYSIAVTSIIKGFTGGRPDVYRLDDPIAKEKLIREPTWIIKAREHLDSTRFAIKTNGLTIVFLTPYAELDVAGKILREEGVATITAPFRKLRVEPKKGGEWHVFHCPVRDEAGHSVMPNIYPDEYLAKLEADDPDDFAAQMMCEPAEGSHMPLRPDEIEPLWVPREQVARWWPRSIHCDTAFKDPKRRERGDFNVIQVWAHERSSGLVFYENGWRNNRWTASEFVEHLVMLLQDYKRQRIPVFVVTDEVTPGGKQGMFEEFLFGACKSAGVGMPNFLALPRSGKAKDARILTGVYGWKSGKVRLVTGATEVQQLVYEMTHIGYSQHDDMADAGADVFHPEVYIAGGTGTVGDVPVPARPYDKLLWSRPGDLTPDEIRSIYDHEEEDSE